MFGLFEGGIIGGLVKGIGSIKSPFHVTGVQTKRSPYQSGSPYDAGAPEWDSSGMPVGRMPRGDYALDYQYEANRRAEQRRQALWGDAQGALQQGADLLQTYRPGGASALASGIFNQQSNLYGTQALNTVAPDMLIGWREDERQKALAEEQRRYNASQKMAKLGMLLNINSTFKPLGSAAPVPQQDTTGSANVGGGDNSFGQPSAANIPGGGHLSDGGPVPAVQSAYGGGEVPGALPSTLAPDAAGGAGGGVAPALSGGMGGGEGGGGLGALGAILGAVTGGAGAAAGGAIGGAGAGAGAGAAAGGAAGGAAAGAGAGAAAGGAAGGMSAAGASGLGSGVAGGNVGLTSFSGADVAQAAGRIAPVGQNSAIMDYASQPYSQELTRMMQQSAFDRLAAARSPTLVRPMSGYRTGGGF